MRTLRWTLRWSILAALLVLGTLLTVISHVHSLRTAETLIDRELQQRLQALGSRNSAYIEHDLARGDLAAAATKVALVAIEPYAETVILTDERGRARLASRHELIGAELPSEAGEMFSAAVATLSSRVWFEERGATLSGVFPVRLELAAGELRPQRIGALYLRMDLAPHRAAMHASLLTRSLFMGSVVLLVVLAMWVLFGVRFTRRVEDVASAFEAVANGRLDTQLPIRGQDELAHLARGFNDMVQRLRIKRDRLTTNEARLRAHIDAAPDAIMLNRGGKIVYANATALRMHGARDLSEFSMRPLEQAVHPAYLASIRARLALLFAGEQVPTVEEKWLRLDGTPFDVEVSAVSYMEGTERVVQVIGRDVTERRRQQEELRQSEQRFRLLIERVEEYAIYMLDATGNVTTWNLGAERIYGYCAEDIMGRSAATFYTPEARNAGRPERALSEARESGRFQDEGWRVRKDGSRMWADVLLTPLYDSGGKLFGFSEITRDLTARRAVEQRVAASEARFADIVGSAMDAIVCVDANQRITLFNRAAERTFGWPAARVLGEPLDMLLPERFRAQHREDVHTFGMSGITARSMGGGTQLVGLRANGEEFPIEASISQTHAGGEHMLTAIVRDLTEHVRAQEMQAKLERQLLHSQKMQSIGTLAGGIAHDFNNILLAITGNVRLALEDCPREHPLRTSLEEISKAAARASDLVRRILTFSRVNEAQRQAVHLGPVIEEAVRLLRAAIPAMIDIQTHVPGGLPAVLADPGEVLQVVMNLGTNAAHAIGERAGTLQVFLDQALIEEREARIMPDLSAGLYVRLSIIDDGSGMDSTTVERMFDPFFTTKPPGQGTGLGLAVVHGIVRNHGGAITVDSEPGRGTRIDVYWPSADGPQPVAASPASRVHVCDARRRVVYLDDEEPLVFLIARMLERLNYEVVGFTDPILALAQFRERPDQFDAFISDLAMPHMDGFDVVRKVLEIRPDIPVVMTSGYVRAEDAERAKRMGVKALVLKPNTVEELASTLHSLFA